MQPVQAHVDQQQEVLAQNQDVQEFTPWTLEQISSHFDQMTPAQLAEIDESIRRMGPAYAAELDEKNRIEYFGHQPAVDQVHPEEQWPQNQESGLFFQPEMAAVDLTNAVQVAADGQTQTEQLKFAQPVDQQHTTREMKVDPTFAEFHLTKEEQAAAEHVSSTVTQDHGEPQKAVAKGAGIANVDVSRGEQVREVQQSDGIQVEKPGYWAAVQGWKQVQKVEEKISGLTEGWGVNEAGES